MALFVRDPEVDALAEQVRKLTGARTKTEAVRRALEAQLVEARRALPFKQRLARAKALADAMGPSEPDFDMKCDTDLACGAGERAKQSRWPSKYPKRGHRS